MIYDRYTTGLLKTCKVIHIVYIFSMGNICKQNKSDISGSGVKHDNRKILDLVQCTTSGMFKI